MKNIVRTSAVVVIALMTVLSSTVYADREDRDHRERGDRGDRHEMPSRDYRMDSRYDHNRSYPREGIIVRSLPERRYPIHYRDRNYFYFGGVWYLPSGPSFVVVNPPLGIVVPILPPFYTTIWFGGVPYYYANDVYYVWRPDLNAYQVAAPPAIETQPKTNYMADELYIYPKQGQSEQQQADDRYACHRWSADQTKYDPTQPPTGTSIGALNKQREDYNRAMKACLEGKGYSVR